MYSLKEKKEEIIGKELDDYLAKGWYRIEDFIFTTQFFIKDQEIYSSTWIRLPLKDFAFNKRNRKTLSRAKKRFSCRVTKASFSKEKDALYAIYRENFKGVLHAPDIESNLSGPNKRHIFDTWNIEIYDGDKLIALSYFDKGTKTMASILGIYHPDYRKYSLGYVTLLLEIQVAMDLDFTYYYPGYVIHGNPRFEYKKNIGAVEYYDFLNQVWLEEKKFNQNIIPVTILRNKTIQLYRLLQEDNIDSTVYLYNQYEANLHSFLELFLEHPLFIGIDLEDSINRIVIVFDLFTAKYIIYECQSLLEYDEVLAQIYNPYIIMKKKKLYSSSEAKKIVSFLNNNPNYLLS